MAQFLARIVMPRSRSRSLESMTRSTRCWCAAKVPDWRSSLSTRVVLPWSTWAMIAMFRIARGMRIRSSGKRRRFYHMILYFLSFFGLVSRVSDTHDPLRVARAAFPERGGRPAGRRLGPPHRRRDGGDAHDEDGDAAPGAPRLPPSRGKALFRDRRGRGRRPD